MNLLTWLRSEWDRVAGFAFVVAGAVCLFAAYHGVKDTPFVADQLTYVVSGGLGGIFCLGVGLGFLISADLHDEWRKLDRIERAVSGRPAGDAMEAFETLMRQGTDTKGVRSSSGSRAAVPATPALTANGTSGALTLAPNWGRDRLRRALPITVLSLLVPLTMMTVGWRRAADTADMDVALRGAGIGVVGLALALGAIAVYMVWLRARVTGREARLFGVVLLAERGQTPLAPARSTHVRMDDDEVLVVDGLRRYHRTGCPALAGLDPAPVRRSQATGDACGICHPT